ncbi:MULTISPECIES: helix-turn-helix domain-containing protein [unclassified Paenibacillus]|uniref:helix-turn-helix domain-containing protein n=1 Tax=unclassified Paenibacillus TaxID=185978 RepID=UPI0009A7F8D0|nr:MULTISPECIES: AraC family transcriptional regulator [unclassified Paenibacillus]SLK20141.1 Helix-turn-helix domain-containing protein [Paenibacillus sp. RU5A]SOC76080.1 Helix-turn-helix domain-containing protein [Paenibacillus sp. RU26A]SOC77788.1 Helix-turn-helix domain-containing protein [Paenibacillus sp. RU5M]
MKFVTVSAYSVENIFPKTEIFCSSIHHQAYAIIVPSSTFVSYDGNELLINKMSILVGKNFSLQNLGSSYAEIRKITFNHSFSDLDQYPLVIQASSKTMRNINKLSKLICGPLAGRYIAETEEQIETLLRANIETFSRRSLYANTKEQTRTIDSRLIMVHRYIRKHYAEPLTLQLLAELIYCNPVYLSNSFSKIFDISPMRYLQQVRMKRACDLLKTSNLNIKELTIAIGYISNSQFSSIFKKHFSFTPAEYRRFIRMNCNEGESVTH